MGIARGQTIGNPSIHSLYETQALIRKHEAIPKWTDYTRLEMCYPKVNFGREGVNYLMSVLMGGQCDIDVIKECCLVDLETEKLTKTYLGPRFGVSGIREILGVYGRPLLGGIIKPKIGLTPEQVADICKQMADGGVDFIKEDEILANQPWCPMRKRIPLVAKALKGYKVIYTVCITGDGKEIVKRAKMAHELGAWSVHLNLWCGLGAYNELRKKTSLPIFFQKSGDKVWTTGPYSIDYNVICKLVNLIGCDFAHVGMYGGYLAESVDVLKQRIASLKTTIPSFSCGATPQLVPQIRQLFGDDLMITSGGYICGHPKGITEAVKEFRKEL